MMEATIYQQYKAQSLETMTSGEVVVKLFEEASKQISMAIFLTNQHLDVKAYECVSKAQKIVSSLESSLDMSYPISRELRDIYLYLFKALSDAIVAKDINMLKRLLGLVDELKVAFRQADKIARASK